MTESNVPPRAIEELSMNAWPALQTMLYDGWILRFANGYTRRANSINPLYSSRGDTGRKIDACESIYRQMGYPVVFKMTAASEPPDLDVMLADRAYQTQACTSVQTLDLRPVRPPCTDAVVLAEDLSQEWLSAFCRMSGVGEQHRSTLRRILEAIAPERRFASLCVDGQIVACGMAALDGGFLGLFDIVTDPHRRRQGHGRGLVGSLLDWGYRRAAHMAYLQVMLDNEPALSLYRKLGFTETYRYWYRVKP
jgi:N-acetylglutamate synthase